MRVPATALGEIEAHLAAVAAAERSFPIHLRGTGTFRPVSSVVFVALAVGIGGCERLERAVRRGPPDREPAFPYHPHVTVAHHLADDLLDRAFKKLADCEVPGVGLLAVRARRRDGIWRPRRGFLFGAAAPLSTPGHDR